MVFTLIACGLLLVFVAAELCSRYWMRRFAHTYPWPPFFHCEMLPDPTALPQLRGHNRIRVNSFGARGDEDPRSGRIYRMLACGGSAVEGAALDDYETWPHVLQAKLNRIENLHRLGVDRACVWNIGRSGLTAAGLRYLLPRALPRMPPMDVIMIMIGASEVNYWTSIGTPAKLPASQPPPWLDIAWHREHVWGWKPRTLALTMIARRMRQYIAPPVSVRKGVGKRISEKRALRANAKEFRDVYPDASAWLAYYESVLTQVVRIACAHAKRVLLISQPWFDKAEPSPEEEAMFWHGYVDNFNFWETEGDNSVVPRLDTFYTHRVLCELMSCVEKVTAKVAQSSGIEFIGRTKALEHTVQFYYDQFHFTPEGSRVMGQFVCDELLRRQLGTPLRSGMPAFLAINNPEHEDVAQHGGRSNSDELSAVRPTGGCRSRPISSSN